MIQGDIPTVSEDPDFLSSPAALASLAGIAVLIYYDDNFLIASLLFHAIYTNHFPLAIFYHAFCNNAIANDNFLL